tara:strand:+ start:1221 stop:1448 length:228 start_codon:yes stop_codon:yes gene_type:complete
MFQEEEYWRVKYWRLKTPLPVTQSQKLREKEEDHENTHPQLDELKVEEIQRFEEAMKIRFPCLRNKPIFSRIDTV